MASSTGSGLGPTDITRQLLQRKPFSLLSPKDCQEWLSKSKLVALEPGQTLIARNQLQDRLYLVVSGSIRLLTEDNGQILTLDKRGSGQLVGWSSILRASACEWVSASEDTMVLALPASNFVSLASQFREFQECLLLCQI